MPQGIGYGPDASQRMVDYATDPTFNMADPTTTGVLQQGVPQPGGSVPTMDYRAANPSYEQGGMVSTAGPQQPGLQPQGAQQGPVPAQAMQQEMQRIMQNSPQQVQEVKQAMMEAVQDGEITPQELNTMKQLLTSAAQNPQLWPQLRQFMIQNGMADDEDIPQEYDQGFVMITLMVLESLNTPGPQGQAPMPESQGQPPQAVMEDGGEVPTSNNADGSVAINAHKGEYIIPDDIVRKKGTDFFDKMIGNDGKANV